MSSARPDRLLRWFVNPFFGQERSYWRAVTACFLAASTFWLLNAFNKTYTTRIAYPIAWRYDESRFIPVKPLPKEVQVNVTARGWKLLRRQLMLDVKPAELLLGALPTTRYVTSRMLRPALQQAMDGLQYNYLIADTLWVEFDRLVSRKLALGLSPAADGAALPYAARFEPDSIVFRGPAGKVNTLPSPYPVHLPQAPAGSSTGDIQVPIGGPDLVQTNVQDVRVRLLRRPVVTVPVQVVPELLDAPAGHEYKFSPATVRVRLQFFPEDTAGFKPEQVRVQLHYGQFINRDSSLRPFLAEKPVQARGYLLLTPGVRVTSTAQE
ncbi:YbbR-like domain-containing protein [Hymenobacter seoulensis]